MRSLGIDYGEKRIGVSVSDPTGKVVFGVGTIENKQESHVIAKLRDILEKYGDIMEIIVGLPLSLKGKEGFQAEKVKTFIEALNKNMSIPVKSIDERLTTVESTRRLQEAGIGSRKIRSIIDEAAAINILQGYLNSKK